MSEFFASLHLEIVEAAGRCGLSARQAADMAQSVEEGLRRGYATQKVYIGAAKERWWDEAIRREFRGDNAAEIMRRYEISRSTLYRVIGQRD